MLILLIRTIILYLLVVVTIRIMGKHQIGQLQPYELVITIMISEIAAVPMQDTEIPLLNGVFPIITLLFIQTTFSFFSLKSERFRRLLDGSPSLIIENGKINQSELKRLRFNIDDLMEKLRTKDFANISDIEYAILETSGDLSVIPKSQKRPVCPKDLNIDTSYEGLPSILVADGNLKRANLQRLNLTEDWLLKQLKSHGIHHWNQVFLANLDTTGSLYIQPMTDKKKRRII